MLQSFHRLLGFLKLSCSEGHRRRMSEAKRYADGKLLDETNWREFIAPETFDLTYSRLVLSHGSGTSSDWRKRLSHDKDIIILLVLCGQMTQSVYLGS